MESRCLNPSICGYLDRRGYQLCPVLSLEPVRPLDPHLVLCLSRSLAFEGKYVAAKGRLRPETRLPLTVVGSAILPVSIAGPDYSSVVLTHVRSLFSGLLGRQIGRTGSILFLQQLSSASVSTLYVLCFRSAEAILLTPIDLHAIFQLLASRHVHPFSFSQMQSYTDVSAYPRYAASALASNDFARSLMAAAMPIVSVPLFHNLGIDWGNTIIGGCSVLFIPLP